VHPDNQYNPKLIPNMVLPIYLGQCDVVLASRFIVDPIYGSPIKGGMPIHKVIVNRILTFVQNLLMGTKFSEFHTGYRAYAAHVVRDMDFTKFSDDYVFDNQMLARLVFEKRRIHQIGVETRYFPEAHSINFRRGAIYAAGCLNIGLRFLLHQRKWKSWPLLENPAPDAGSKIEPAKHT